jgi:hypothetical protein
MQHVVVLAGILRAMCLISNQASVMCTAAVFVHVAGGINIISSFSMVLLRERCGPSQPLRSAMCKPRCPDSIFWLGDEF